MLSRRSLFSTAALLGTGLTTLGSAPARAAATVPASALDEVVPTKAAPIALNFNENSMGMSASAKKAVIDSLGKAFRYPDDAKEAARKATADLNGVSPELVTLGSGSSQVIQAVVASQVQKARAAGKKVQLLQPVPTFGVAESYAAALNVPVTNVPLNAETLEIDVEALKKAAARFDGVTIVYFCNPNNPTGIVTDKAKLSGWIEASAAAKAPVFFLVDEAYGEFVENPAFESGVVLVKKGLDNLIVTRTFSKLYALAGLRLGYGIATKSVLAECDLFESVDNINLAGAVAAAATLADKTYLETSLAATKLSKAIVTKAFDELGIKYLPSEANFIFHQVKGDSETYRKHMADANILVGRAFPPFTGWNRLTLGTPGEMKAFVKVLKDFRSKGLI